MVSQSRSISPSGRINPSPFRLIVTNGSFILLDYTLLTGTIVRGFTSFPLHN